MVLTIKITRCPSRRTVRLIAPALLLASVSATPTLAQPPGPATCASPEQRRIRFRYGRFSVRTASGTRAGESIVTPAAGDCALLERWTGAVSGTGRGMTFYDTLRKRWRQVYVSQVGNTLDLTGNFIGADLVLTGENATFDGHPGLHRMTWSPLPGGGVRQLWEFSADNGTTWRQLFDGRYRHRR